MSVIGTFVLYDAIERQFNSPCVRYIVLWIGLPVKLIGSRNTTSIPQIVYDKTTQTLLLRYYNCTCKKYDYAIRLHYDTINVCKITGVFTFRDVNTPYFARWFEEEQIALILNFYLSTDWCDTTIEDLKWRNTLPREN